MTREVALGYQKPARLAYDCSCHLTPPCGYCERWCEDCEGTGELRFTPETALLVVVNGKTRLHLVRPIYCGTCEGLGYLEEDD